MTCSIPRQAIRNRARREGARTFAKLTNSCYGGRVSVEQRSELVDADREAILVRIVRRYTVPLTRFFARRLPSSAEVQDLVQDVFLRLSRMPDPQAIRKPDQFVFTTAANLLRDRARRGADPAELATATLERLEIPDSGFAPDRVMDSRAAAHRVAVALDRLPPRTKHVFVLRTLEGWKMAEVAKAVGISTRAAEKHQARALAFLAAELEDWRP